VDRRPSSEWVQQLVIESVKDGPLDDLRGSDEVGSRSDFGGVHCSNRGTNLCRIERRCADNQGSTKRAATVCEGQ
jgi:hypothetical protein